MKQLEGVNYDKINYSKYREKIKNIINNPELQKFGLNYEILGFTNYDYPIEAITLGYGDKEMFIVGGTHGSEVIGIDFVMQLIDNIPNMEQFNPELYKIIFIPLQNPEGFDISSSTFSDIADEEYREKSYEYYERHRTDVLISMAMSSLNEFVSELLNSNYIISAQLLLLKLKQFINNDNKWQSLNDVRAIPQIDVLIKKINEIDNVTDFNDLKSQLISVSNSILRNLNFSDSKEQGFMLLLTEFRNGFSGDLIWNDIDNENRKKLHQLMFENVGFDNIAGEALKKQVTKLYNDYPFPEGSQIKFDANGNGVNLNANTFTNPGIKLKQEGTIVYGNRDRDNIPRYFKGPIGAPSVDVNHFEYEKENKYLFNILNDSYNRGKYLFTFLYHGTGGLIYYKPEETVMDFDDYSEFYNYNKILAEIYSEKTKYKILEVSDISGYGDYLRKTFPGVLLIELSKMCGNPIAPYGDYNNIYNVMNDNIEAFKSVLGYCNELLENKHSL